MEKVWVAIAWRYMKFPDQKCALVVKQSWTDEALSKWFFYADTNDISLSQLISLRYKVDSGPAAGFHLQFQDISPVPVWNVVSLENGAKYSGLENSTKYSGLEHIAKYSSLEKKAKYSDMEHSTKYSCLEHRAKYSSLELCAKYSGLKKLRFLFLCRD